MSLLSANMKKRAAALARRTGPSAEVRARTAWGETVPAWVIRLARACDAHGQAAAAVMIGYSPSTVSHLLKNKYGGGQRANLDRVQHAVETALAIEITCPVMGAISGTECREFQSRPLSGESPLAIRLHRACQTCPRGGGRNAQ